MRKRENRDLLQKNNKNLNYKREKVKSISKYKKGRERERVRNSFIINIGVYSNSMIILNQLSNTIQYERVYRTFKNKSRENSFNKKK